MKSIRAVLIPFAAVAVTFLSLSGNARADVLPLDSCGSGQDESLVGQSCENAGDAHDEPGICADSTCGHTVSDGDGGFTSGESPCVLCLASDGGTPTSDAGASDGGKATTTRDDAGTGSTTSSSSSGCSMTPNTRDGATAFGMLGLGLLGLALGRRKAKS